MLLLASLYYDRQDGQITALQAQNRESQSQVGQFLADAADDARDAKKAALLAEEAARIKIVELDAEKKRLAAKGCK
jgi:hypothetical protein